MMFPLFSENHNSIFLSDEKKCNPPGPDFKFYLSMSTINKNFPYGVMLIVRLISLIFSIDNCKENNLKINIIPYGEIFY